jgi:hypothetical protein
VAKTALELARVHLGDGLDSGFVIGSLAHGGFAKSASDIDIAILGPSTSGMAEAAEWVKAETPRGNNSILARRLSIFHCSWEEFSTPGPTSRFPAIDRLDLMLNGVLLVGQDFRKRHGATPGYAQVVSEAIDFAVFEFGPPAEIEALRGPTLQEMEIGDVTRTILFPARLLSLVRTGRVCSNDAAGRYFGEQPDVQGKKLVLAALRWRKTGRIDHTELSALGGLSLGSLYQTTFEAVRATPGIPTPALTRLEAAEGVPGAVITHLPSNPLGCTPFGVRSIRARDANDR